MQGTKSRRAFTLIELLTVLVIIALIIGITVPVIGRARDSAKAVQTRAMITQIVNASTAFVTDQRRLPGYFKAIDMGQSDNKVRGMSGMENVILDLAGAAAIVPDGTAGSIKVGPSNNVANQISVDPSLLGTGDSANKAYLTLDKRYFVPQLYPSQQATGGANGHTGALDTDLQLPDMVDAWGQPLLAWSVDETATLAVRAPTDAGATAPTDGAFAMKESPTGANAKRALVYYNQNCCFLEATALGKKGIDQTAQSLLSQTGNSANYLETLAGALGSPAAPYKDPANPFNAPIVALKARGGLMIQSAGRDGVYFGKSDNGAKQFPSAKIDYQFNFVNKVGGKTNNAADQLLDKNNKPTTIDVLDKFDDLMGVAGN
jgi:prepilin-type N-terminal cleavage/methylation domain-containing protein